jgi:hypothetical protein
LTGGGGGLPPPLVVVVVVVGRLKVAVTAVSPVTVKLQVPVPEQGPDQPLNEEPLDGVAASVTCVP